MKDKHVNAYLSTKYNVDIEMVEAARDLVAMGEASSVEQVLTTLARRAPGSTAKMEKKPESRTVKGPGPISPKSRLGFYLVRLPSGACWLRGHSNPHVPLNLSYRKLENETRDSPRLAQALAALTSQQRGADPSVTFVAEPNADKKELIARMKAAYGGNFIETCSKIHRRLVTA